MKILGIETSCDETAAAVIEDGRTIHSNVVATQIDMHAQYGGIVPELASRQHMLTFNAVIREAMEKASMELRDLDGIAVHLRPRASRERLLVGVNAAKGLALAEETLRWWASTTSKGTSTPRGWRISPIPPPIPGSPCFAS